MKLSFVAAEVKRMSGESSSLYLSYRSRYTRPHTLRPAGVCVGECAAPRHHAYAKVRQLMGLGEHRVADFTQGIETPDDGIEHYNKMLPRIETLYVTFAAILTAELEDFRLGK